MVFKENEAYFQRLNEDEVGLEEVVIPQPRLRHKPKSINDVIVAKLSIPQNTTQVTRNPKYYQNFARSLHDCDVIFSEKSSLEWKKNMTSRFRYKFTQYITKVCYDFNQKNTWIHLTF